MGSGGTARHRRGIPHHARPHPTLLFKARVAPREEKKINPISGGGFKMPGTGRMATTCQAGKAAAGGELNTETLYLQQQNPAGGSPAMKSEQRMAAMPAPCNRSALGAAAMLPAAAVTSLRRLSLQPPPGRPAIPETSSGTEGFHSCIIHILKGEGGFKKKKKKN